MAKLSARGLVRRVEALALRASGHSQSAVAKHLGVNVRTVRTWDQLHRLGMALPREFGQLSDVIEKVRERETVAVARAQLLEAQTRLVLAEARERRRELRTHGPLSWPPSRPQPRDPEEILRWFVPEGTSDETLRDALAKARDLLAKAGSRPTDNIPAAAERGPAEGPHGPAHDQLEPAQGQLDVLEDHLDDDLDDLG